MIETALAKQIVQDCLSSAEQAMYDGKDFQNDFQKMRIFLEKRIRHLGLAELQSIFYIYLTALGYSIENSDIVDGVEYRVIKGHLPDAEITGAALCLSGMAEWGKASNLFADSRFSFFRLLIHETASIVPPEANEERYVLVSFENIERVFLGIALGEYFDMNYYSLRNSPGVKEVVANVLEKEFRQMDYMAWSRHWREIIRSVVPS